MPLIRDAKLLAYLALRKNPTFKLNKAKARGKMAKFLKENPEFDAWEMQFPTQSLGLSCFSEHYDGSKYNITEAMANPKAKIAMWFLGREKAYGIVPGKWYMMVNNRVFCRLSYKDIGVSGAVSGLKSTRDGKAVIYLTPMKINRKDKEKIMEAVSLQLTKSLSS